MSVSLSPSLVFDKTKFSSRAYQRRVDKPWGYEIHWVPEDAPYMGKILHINAGKRLSLQIHDQKQESYLLIRGSAKITWENKDGELHQTILKAGYGYSTCVGQKHRLEGVTDCDIIEVSTPEIGTTYRLEDDFARPDETEEQRRIERNEN